MADDFQDLDEDEKGEVLICSASLTDEVYEEISNLERFQQVIVYCGYRSKGEELVAKYDKITKVFTKDDFLIDFIMGNEK